ncbi:MAG: phosphotransferase family protein [Halieaceae bacterium]|jgi:aminoglycoside phosphotransferase (APT) family kinase protein|nr:phosphotransferase family protein [Halieaceae bacterium]
MVAKQADISALINIGKLTAWMDGQHLEEGAISDLGLLAGGTQNILLSFTRNGRSFVLRRPPTTPPPGRNKSIQREAHVLEALAKTKVPHARLIAACADEQVIGASFYIMEPVDGFNATNGLPPLHRADSSIRREMGFAFIDCATELARIDYIAVGLKDFGRPDNFLHRQVDRWRRQLTGYQDFNGWPGPAALPGVDYVSDYLAANCPENFTPGILHGDYSIGNVMYCRESSKIKAIVDWELSTIGDPLVDLGHIVATWHKSGGPNLSVLRVKPWKGFPSAEELITRYASNCTRDLSQINWYIVLACCRLAIIIEGTYARACAGEASMETGILLHETAIRLIQRALYHIETPVRF